MYSRSLITQILGEKSEFYLHFIQKLFSSLTIYQSINVRFRGHVEFWPSLIPQLSVSMLQYTLTPVKCRLYHLNHVFMFFFNKFIPKSQFCHWIRIDRATAILDVILSFCHLLSPSGLCLCYSVTLTSIGDLLEAAVVPDLSHYHLVSMSHGLLPLMARMNIWFVVESYLKVSQKHRQTVIDLCLPYVDREEKKVYLGRYIFLKGKILAIRLCTESMKGHSSW